MTELDLYCPGSSYWIQMKVPFLYTKGMSQSMSQKYESYESVQVRMSQKEILGCVSRTIQYCLATS